MGNEMGNNNTSGVKEQDNSAVEAPEEVLHGAGANTNGVEGENQVVSLAEDKNFDEEVNGLVSDVQSVAEEQNVLFQTSNQKDEEGSKAHPSEESLHVEVVSKEVGACLSKEEENHEKQKESILVGNLFGGHKHQPEKQTTVEKEEERERITTTAAISATLDAEVHESVDTKPDQLELTNSHGNPIVQDDNESVSITGTEISHSLDTDNSNDLDGGNSSNTQLTYLSVAYDRKHEVEGRNDAENDGRTEMNGIENKCNEDFSTGKNLETVQLDKPENFHLKVSAPEDKYIAFIEEPRMMENLSGADNNKNNQNPNQLHKEETESTIDNEQAAQQEFNAIGLNNVNEEYLNLECQKEKEKVLENGYPNDVMHPRKLTGKPKEMEVTQEIEEKMEALFAIKDDTKAREMENQCPSLPFSPEKGEAFVLCDPVSAYIPHDKHDFVLESETVKSSIESSHVSPIRSHDHQKDTLIQSWFAHGGSEALTAEAPAESVQSQDQHDNAIGAEVVQSSYKEFLSQVPTQQQENVMAAETRPSSSDSNMELKQKSGGDCFSTKALMINSAELIEEILVSQVKFAIKQFGKNTSEDIATAPEMSLEDKTSENQSNERNIKVETPALANGGFKAQGGPRRFSTESMPNGMAVHAHMQKSPSFNFDIRLGAKNEESDQTPLLYREKSNSVGLVKPPAHHSQQSLQYQAMPVEEKVITLDRNDSVKSRTPFLGFTKEEAEANIVVTATAKKTIKVASTTPKTKEKHKRRTSLFSNCMCCATLMN